MKLNKFAVAIALAASLTSVAHAADQGHGTVTFTGSIIEAPCSINPASVDQTVELGSVATSALADGGTSVPRPFQIKLENCSLSTATGVTSTFTGAKGANDLLGMTGTAKGASIAITDGTGAVVKLGTPSAAQQLQDGNNTLSFAAYLKGDGDAVTVTPGEFQSIADFSLSYE